MFKVEGPGLGAFDIGPWGPIYLTRLLVYWVYWVGPEIHLADFDIYLAGFELYLADFEIYLARCVCTGDGCCCATSHNSSRGAKRRAPPKAGLLLLWLVAQQPSSPVQTQPAK